MSPPYFSRRGERDTPSKGSPPLDTILEKKSTAKSPLSNSSPSKDFEKALRKKLEASHASEVAKVKKQMEAKLAEREEKIRRDVARSKDEEARRLVFAARKELEATMRQEMEGRGEKPGSPQKSRREVSSPDKSVQMAVLIAQKQEREAAKLAVADTTSKLQAKHAIEMAALREDEVKRLDLAKKEAAKRASSTTTKALAAESALRKAAEEKRDELQIIANSVSAAHHAAAVAKQEAVEANQARIQTEAAAKQQTNRTNEVLTSFEERVETMRRYAESLETAIAKVTAEKEARVAASREAANAEIAEMKMQTAIEIATQRAVSTEALERASAQTRAVQLEVLVAKAETAAAVARAAASDVAKSETLALMEDSKNDTAMKKEANVRVAALTMDIEAAKKAFASKREAEMAVAADALEQAEERAKAAERVVAATNQEVGALVELSSALSVAAKASAAAAADKAEAQLQAAYAGADVMRREAEVMKVELETRFEAASAEAKAKLESGMIKSEAMLEAAKAETAAKEVCLTAIADATVEAANTSAAAKEEAVAAEDVGRKEAAAGQTAAAAVAADSEIAARFESAQLQREAQAECEKAILKASRAEVAALIAERDAVDKVRKSKSFEKIAADIAAAEKAKASAQAKQDYEEIKAAALASLEDKVQRVFPTQLDAKLSEIKTALETANAGADSHLRKTTTAAKSACKEAVAAAKKAEAIAKTRATAKQETTIAEAQARLKSTLAAAQANLDEAMLRVAAMGASAEGAVEGADSSAVHSAADLMAAEWEAKKAVEAIEVRVKELQAAREELENARVVTITEGTSMVESAKESLVTTLQEVEAEVEDSRQAAEALRSKALAEMHAVAEAVAGTVDENARAAEAAAAKAANESLVAAKAAVVKAEREHYEASAKSNATLEALQKAADVARAEAAEKLEFAQEDVERTRNLEEAAREAGVAMKDAYERRRAAEAQRRKTEDVKTAEQHKAIRRRPGGGPLLDSLKTSLGQTLASRILRSSDDS